MSTKITNVSALSAVLNGEVITPEIREKLENMKASFEKRKATKRVGPTKAQIANAALAEQIAEAMVADVAYGNAEIADLIPALNGATPQKVAPLMKALTETGKVVTTKVKGKNVYTLA